MSTKMDARQIISRDLLSRLANASGAELDNLLRSLNSEVTPPFEIRANSTPNLSVTVSDSTVTNPETGKNRGVPAVALGMPKITGGSGTITFPAASGGTITVSPGNNNTLICTTGNYAAVLIYIDASNSLNVLVGDESATLQGAIDGLLPAPDSTTGIGFVVVQNTAGVIQNIQNSSIYQFGSGSGSGSGGNGNELLERIKDKFQDSSFEFVTPVVFRTDQETLTDAPNTTATYSVVNRTYLMDAAEQFTSVQMADADFQSEEREIDRAELIAYWKQDAVDTLATYEISRNGTDYQTVDMERVGNTDTYRGLLFFDEETATTIVENNSGSSASEVLNATTVQELSQEIVITNETKVIQTLSQITVNKTGSPIGDLYFEIARDNAGVPGDIIGNSSLVSIGGLTAGANAVTLPLGVILSVGTYHLIAKTSSTYKGSYSAGVDQISINTRTGGAAADAQTYNGTTWSALTGEALNFRLEGRPQILKARIISGAADRELAGFGVFYGFTGPVATGVKNIEYFKISGDDDVTEFTINKFKPNPDLLKVYDVNTGLVYRYGSFTISGNKVVFNNGQFLYPGEEITLIFDQNMGGAFDNSDDNANLLADNRLGSTDPNIDRSVAGEGVLLRATNGTLVECSLLWNGTAYEWVFAEV